MIRQPGIILLLILALAASCGKSGQPCPPAAGVALQILGSGGPIADDGRASSAYVVWVDGQSRVLVDFGGGAFLRFGEAHASFNDLDFVGLSHFHADHSADFPALLKSGSFSNRKRPLHVAGPDADGQFPGLKDWLKRMLDAESGAYAYLSGFLDGTGGQPMLVAKEISAEAPVTLYRKDGIAVEAMHVPHGIVPAVAFKVTANDKTLVFAGDQNGSNAAFADFAKDASLLVMHLVIPENASGVASRLHARPSVVGEVAARSGARQLVLGHFMARSLREIDRNVALVRKAYDGPVTLAEDLACVTLGDDTG